MDVAMPGQSTWDLGQMPGQRRRCGHVVHGTALRRDGSRPTSAARLQFACYTDAKVNYRLVRPSFSAIAVSWRTVCQYRLAGLVQWSG